ncbi:MAG: tRNA lysidine(34) synthetase TilS [Tissierellia bacterium]|nr:tRNA lysidine(34) synthetase TilS [Tissierellia bacterium]
MKEKVLKAVKEHNLIEEGDNILVGVSGGADSMALLYVLLEIKEEIDFNIFIAHVNHGVRGEEALEDEKYVERTAKKLGIPYFSKQVNMEEYARKKKISAEEAGRELRYSFFREILSKIGGGKIAVAHNKNDQAETLLLRLFRGTGIEGLKGMEYKNKDIIRPILGIEREEIEKYLLDRNIEFKIDRTNLEPIYNRNRIRLEIIPYIQKYYNPNIIDTLWRTSQLMSIDNEFFEEYCQRAYYKILKKKDENSIVLDGNTFKKEHISIQTRIIRNCILELNGSLQGITMKHVEDVVTLFLERGTGKSITLINNLVAKTSYGDFIIEKFTEKENKEDESYIQKINMNGVNYIDRLGCKLKVEIKAIDEVNMDSSNRYRKYFDYDKVQGSLYVRNRRAGDRFVPFGMKGSKKVKDYFIDEKVPKDERNRIPIVTDEKNIIWIVGYRISELYKITKDTKRVLVIQIEK